MVAQKELDPSSSPRAFYGAEVRRLRGEAGLSQEKLGGRLFCSGSYVGQVEVGTRPPNPDLSKRLDTALDTGGHFKRLWELIENDNRFAEHFAPMAELEAQATVIEGFTLALIPGLLQTPAYAREIFRTAILCPTEAELDTKVAARLERAERLLDHSTGPRLWYIVDEGAFRRPVGKPAVMRAQLARIAELIRSTRITLQVIPQSVGAHAGLEGTLTLLSFADEPPVAYTEGPHSGRLMDGPDTVGRCRRTYDLLRAAALSPEASLSLVEQISKEYSND